MLRQSLAYESLSSRGKEAFRQVAQALEMGQTAIDGAALLGQEPMAILQAVVADNPQIIWFNKSAIRQQYSLFGKKVILTGILSGRQRQTMERELDAALGRVLAAIEEENPMTDYDRLVCLYAYLQQHITYDEQELRRSSATGTVGDPMSHNAYGALVRGLAVCDGIAAAFALAASAMGYAVTVVSGNAAKDGHREEHAWNVIRVGNDCYHVDVTWDLSKSKALGVWGYDYFCLDDISVAMDHQWPAGIAPKCAGTAMNWFYHNRCYANNLTQAREIFTRFARSKTTVIRLRLADGVALPGDEGRAVAELLTGAYSAVGRGCAFRYSWNDATRTFTAKLESPVGRQ